MAEETPKAKVAKPVASSDDSKLFGAIAYFMGLITGILVYLMKKEDKFARFHAVQSILFNVVLVVVMIALSVISMILATVTYGIGGICLLLNPLIALGALILWLFLMWKAYSGEKYKLPMIGDMAEKYA